MRSNYSRVSGKVQILPLMIIAVAILVIFRVIWLIPVNDHFDTLVSDYISQTDQHTEADSDKLKADLLGGSNFMKLNVWNKAGLVKNKKLYEEMMSAQKMKLRKQEDKRDSLSTDIINL